MLCPSLCWFSNFLFEGDNGRGFLFGRLKGDFCLGTRVASWISLKCRTLAVPVSLAQNIEIFTHALSYFYQFYTGQRAKILDSSGAKYQTPGNPIGDPTSQSHGMRARLMIILAFNR